MKTNPWVPNSQFMLHCRIPFVKECHRVLASKGVCEAQANKLTIEWIIILLPRAAYPRVSGVLFTSEKKRRQHYQQKLKNQRII